MKKLVIITVGKTHSGKTTFAHALEHSQWKDGAYVGHTPPKIEMVPIDI